ncbi:MAG: DUF3772 domain-containing protein [Pseudomonadota bacterium]
MAYIFSHQVSRIRPAITIVMLAGLWLAADVPIHSASLVGQAHAQEAEIATDPASDPIEADTTPFTPGAATADPQDADSDVETTPNGGAETEPDTTNDAPGEPELPQSVGNGELSAALSEILIGAETRFEGIGIVYQQAEAALLRDELDQGDIAELRQRVTPLIDEVRLLTNEIDPILDQLLERLEGLGSPPEEGAPPEAISVQETRAQLEVVIAETDAAAKRGQLLIARGEQIVNALAERRRDLFARTLAERGSSLLSPALWQRAVTDFPATMRALRLLLGDSSRVMSANLTPIKTFVLLVAIVVAALILTVLRSRLLRLVIRDPEMEAPDAFAKAVGAAWVAFLYFVLPMLAFGTVFGSLEVIAVTPRRLNQLLLGLAGALGIYFFLTALARAILAPAVPGWRIADYDTPTAWRLYSLIVVIAGVFAIDQFLDTLLDVLASPLDVDVAVTALAAAIIAVLTVLCLRAAAASRSLREDGASDDEDVGPSPRRILFRITLWLLSLTVIVAAVTGYTAFASYLATQAVSASAVIAVVAIMLILIDSGFERLGDPTRPVSRAITRTLGVGQSIIGQITALASGLLKLVVIILAAVTILAPWGFEPSDWLDWFRQAFFGFQLGGVTISLSTILAAVTLFFVGVVVTRTFQHWLEMKYLPRTRLDIGIRTSLRTAAGYVGIVAAAAFAVSFVGLDLANLAIVAGALSVGIGFGLQSIVNNFVSGLILLAERPIKVGDWIVVGAEQGYVRRISVRATQIETFDRATVVVPNSDLISGVVKNMMLNNMMGRIVVSIGVSYDSDVDHVREILLDCAHAHERVLSYPAPNVYFMEFGDSSLNFALYAYIPDVDYVLTVHSDLRFAIFRAFNKAGIEIPFPQRDLHIKSTVPGAEPIALPPAQTGEATS